MTEIELNELRELLVERVDHPLINFYAPVRVWELLVCPKELTRGPIESSLSRSRSTPRAPTPSTSRSA